MLDNKKVIATLMTAFVLMGCGSSSGTSDYGVADGAYGEGGSHENNNDENNNDGDNNDGGGNTNGGTVTLPTQYRASSGRILGAQCAQCHGTNGVSKTSWDSIAGEGEFASEGFGGHPIMQTIADGYTPTEKQSIDSWLNTLPGD